MTSCAFCHNPDGSGAPAVFVLLVAGASTLLVAGLSAEDTLARIAKLHEPCTTTETPGGLNKNPL